MSEEGDGHGGDRSLVCVDSRPGAVLVPGVSVRPSRKSGTPNFLYFLHTVVRDSTGW